VIDNFIQQSPLSPEVEKGDACTLIDYRWRTRAEDTTRLTPEMNNCSTTQFFRKLEKLKRTTLIDYQFEQNYVITSETL
jgi:GH25 family lysozyme M1 (1,4-beta-N-acetylmuramidase)